jgi:hypothetical protein
MNVQFAAVVFASLASVSGVAAAGHAAHRPDLQFAGMPVDAVYPDCMIERARAQARCEHLCGSLVWDRSWAHYIHLLRHRALSGEPPCLVVPRKIAE